MSNDEAPDSAASNAHLRNGSAPDWVTTAPRLDVESAWERYRLGVRYAFYGVRLVTSQPSLWPLVIAPALINLGLLVAAFVGAWWAIPAMLSWLWSPDPATTSGLLVVLWTVARWLLIGVVVVLAAAGLYLISGLIASPFLDKLSERVETMVLGPYDEPVSLRVVVGDLVVSVTHSILSLLLWAGVMLSLLTLNLVPVVGSVLEVVLSIMVSAFFVSRETMDGAMSRRRLSFAHKLRVVRAHNVLLQGFGQISAAMLWIPLLNFVALPMATAGGTLLFCHLELQGLVPNAEGDSALRSDRRTPA